MKFLTKERIVWLVFLLISLGVGFVIYKQNQNINEQYLTSEQNNKAFLSQIKNNENEIAVFKTNIETLEYINDSISNKLLKVTHQLGIKNEQIKELTYLATEISRVDTVIFRDTIFRDPDINIDTLIGDKWVNTHLKLKYPNHLVITPTVFSEKEVVLYSSRETVNPPNKYWICRLFQKKHTVIKAVINEENPYIKSKQNVFIQTQED
jgi:hypothetical protein